MSTTTSVGAEIQKIQSETRGQYTRLVAETARGQGNAYVTQQLAELASRLGKSPDDVDQDIADARNGRQTMVLVLGPESIPAGEGHGVQKLTTLNIGAYDKKLETSHRIRRPEWQSPEDAAIALEIYRDYAAGRRGKPNEVGKMFAREGVPPGNHVYLHAANDAKGALAGLCNKTFEMAGFSTLRPAGWSGPTCVELDNSELWQAKLAIERIKAQERRGRKYNDRRMAIVNALMHGQV